MPNWLFKQYLSLFNFLFFRDIISKRFFMKFKIKIFNSIKSNKTVSIAFFMSFGNHFEFQMKTKWCFWIIFIHFLTFPPFWLLISNYGIFIQNNVNLNEKGLICPSNKNNSFERKTLFQNQRGKNSLHEKHKIQVKNVITQQILQSFRRVWSLGILFHNFLLLWQVVDLGWCQGKRE